ncbi:MAG: phosphoribosylformylglycinamidine synthase I [Candidatus Hadarchaeales archaeon]
MDGGGGGAEEGLEESGVVRACVVRAGGTNCDGETKVALEEAGAEVELVHFRRMLEEGLRGYDVLVIPGGFSFGDRVRAGAIMGKELAGRMLPVLREFVEGGGAILGICNGFQVLVEAGLLPGFKWGEVQAALALNNSAKFECRWTYLRVENGGKCLFTRGMRKGEVVRMPVAHAEGKFLFPAGREKEYLRKLREKDQLVFRYCDRRGRPAGGRYPVNPNGSFFDIAGICDSTGRIMGLMPHPERAVFGWQLPDWTGGDSPPEWGDGRKIFSSIVENLRR